MMTALMDPDAGKHGGLQGLASSGVRGRIPGQGR